MVVVDSDTIRIEANEYLQLRFSTDHANKFNTIRPLCVVWFSMGVNTCTNTYTFVFRKRVQICIRNSSFIIQVPFPMLFEAGFRNRHFDSIDKTRTPRRSISNLHLVK